MFHKKSAGQSNLRVINPTIPNLSLSEYEIIRQIWSSSSDRPLKKNKNYCITTPLHSTRMSYQFTHNIKLIDINPLRMRTQQRKILFKAFSGVNFQRMYQKNKLYLLKLSSKTLTTFFQLTHDIVFRHSDFFGKHSGEDRFEVISNAEELGRGTFGDVAAIEATLFARNKEMHCKFKATGRRRIVKVLSCKDEVDVERVKKEYRMSCIAGHLHIKEPTFFKAGRDAQAYLVMRRIEGVTLYDLLEDAVNGVIGFSPEKRINLSIAILKALANQVHARKIIHKDFKTTNIMVYEENEQFSVNVIDFGISETFDENQKISEIERFPYVAPELRASVMAINNYKSDIYSAARVIAQIFGFDMRVISAAKLWNEFEDGFCLEGLFENVFDMSDQGKKRIRNLLLGLGHPVLDRRWSIGDGIEELEDIRAKEAVPRLGSAYSRRFLLC